MKRFVTGWLIWLLGAPVAAIATEWTYTVRPGDTLWDVVDRYAVNLYYVDRLQALNGISEPRRLPIGATLRIPVKWLKQEPVSVTVVSVNGPVSARRRDTDDETPLNAGDELRAGDSIVTGESANALLRFADGSTMNVRQSGRVEFDTLTQYGDTGMVDSRARLQRGRISVQVPELKGAASRYEISTPSATTAVRGTGYRVSVDDAGRVSRTEVLDGTVSVFDLNFRQAVAAGFGTVAALGSDVSAPRKLLPPPDLSALPSTVTRVPLQLAWTPQPGAGSYRFQLADSDRFESLIVDRAVDGPSVDGVDLASDGEYVLRVRGRDTLGLEGQDRIHRFTLNAYPEPPFPQAPPDQAVTRADRPEFRWSRPVDAESYLFQLATDAGFSSPLVSKELSGRPAYRPVEPLSPGQYHWRLATRDASGELGPLGDAQTFRYVPPPPTPEPQPPEIDDQRLSIRWPPGQAGQTYVLQLSRDQAFSDMLVDATLEQASYAMARPRHGRYYFRVATVDVDGTPSRYSTTQEIDVPYPYTWQSILLTFGAYLLLL